MVPWIGAQELRGCLAVCGRKNDEERVWVGEGGGVGWGWIDGWTDNNWTYEWIDDDWTDGRSGRAGRPSRACRTGQGGRT